MNTVNEKKKGLKQTILHELIRYWLIVLYMAIFFGALPVIEDCYWPIMESAMRTTELPDQGAGFRQGRSRGRNLAWVGDMKTSL